MIVKWLDVTSFRFRSCHALVFFGKEVTICQNIFVCDIAQASPRSITSRQPLLSQHQLDRRQLDAVVRYVNTVVT